MASRQKQVSPGEFLLLSIELEPLAERVITRLLEKGWTLTRFTRTRALLTLRGTDEREHVLELPHKGKRKTKLALIAILIGA